VTDGILKMTYGPLDHPILEVPSIDLAKLASGLK
jgi:hypothetical protein